MNEETNEIGQANEEVSQEVVEETSEIVQEVATNDYTPILEEIAVRLNNIEVLLTDIFNFIHDFSVVGITVLIGLVSVYALWKEGLKW